MCYQVCSAVKPNPCMVGGVDAPTSFFRMENPRVSENAVA
jgi:hypothetical protein